MALRVETRILVEQRGKDETAKKRVRRGTRETITESSAISIPALSNGLRSIARLRVSRANASGEYVRRRNTLVHEQAKLFSCRHRSFAECDIREDEGFIRHVTDELVRGVNGRWGCSLGPRRIRDRSGRSTRSCRLLCLDCQRYTQGYPCQQISRQLFPGPKNLTVKLHGTCPFHGCASPYGFDRLEVKRPSPFV
jgi:hypothetical protein